MPMARKPSVVYTYTALLPDPFTRRIVARRVSRNLRTELTPTALGKALQARMGRGAPRYNVHGAQNVSVRYTVRRERLG